MCQPERIKTTEGGVTGVLIAIAVLILAAEHLRRRIVKAKGAKE